MTKTEKEKTNLHKMREKSGKNRAQIAKAMGWETNTYLQYELGHRKVANAKISTAVRLAKAVGAKGIHEIMDKEKE